MYMKLQKSSIPYYNMKRKQYTKPHNHLRMLPHLFDINDLNKTMETLGPFILKYTLKSLNRDVDVAGEFLLHFYEKLPVCMEKYNMRKDSPFTGFLVSYLRNEFMNFMRKKRLRQLRENSVSEFAVSINGRCISKHVSADLELLNSFLEEIPLKYRLPLKLYYGMNLNLKELHSFTMQHRCPAKASAMLEDSRSRQNAFNMKKTSLASRSARLNYLIHTEEAGQIRYKKLRSMKKNVDHRLDYNAPVLTITELSELFGMSRSTICRRIARARTHIAGREEDIFKEVEENVW